MAKHDQGRVLIGAALLVGLTGCALPQPLETNPGRAQQPEVQAISPGGESAAAMPLPKLPVLDASQAGKEQHSPLRTQGAPPATIAVDSPARMELRRTEQRTGLSDPEHTRLLAAQARLAAGDEAGALAAAQSLQAELDNDSGSYVVRDDENLFGIAGRSQVYGNSALWPLLWHANEPVLHEPWELRNGMRLRVPVHPTITEVSAALAYSRTHNVLGRRSGGN